MSELHLGLTLGALELGILIATFLYGMAFVQGYRYTLSAARATDAWWMRMLVSFLAYVARSSAPDLPLKMTAEFARQRIRSSSGPISTS
jgi:hypothetical protein